MSEFRVNSITNQDGSAGPQVCGVSTFSGKSGVQIPSGPSDFRRQDGGGRGRGLFAGGADSPRLNVIDKIEIATKGNATDFGDLNCKINIGAASCSSSFVVFLVEERHHHTLNNSICYQCHLVEVQMILVT